MDWELVFGPIGAGIDGVITEAMPVVIPVFITLAGIGIVLGLFRKVGVRR